MNRRAGNDQFILQSSYGSILQPQREYLRIKPKRTTDPHYRHPTCPRPLVECLWVQPERVCHLLHSERAVCRSELFWDRHTGKYAPDRKVRP